MKIYIDVRAKPRTRGGHNRDITLRSERDFAFRTVREGIESAFEGTQYVLAHAEEVKKKLSDKSLEDAMTLLADRFHVSFEWKPAQNDGERPVAGGWLAHHAGLREPFPSLSEAVEAAFASLIHGSQNAAREYEVQAADLRRKVREAKNMLRELGVEREEDDDEEELLDDDD